LVLIFRQQDLTKAKDGPTFIFHI